MKTKQSLFAQTQTLKAKPIRSSSNSQLKLSKEARLRLGYQYDFVRNKGRMAHGPLFRLACASSPESINPTFAIGSNDFSQYTRFQDVFKNTSRTKSMPQAFENHIETKSLQKFITSNCESRVNTQCGIIVSRRVGGAVIRNKVKRRLRNLYRLDRSLIASSFWLVIIASPKAAMASMADLRAEWLRLGRKLSIFIVS